MLGVMDLMLALELERKTHISSLWFQWQEERERERSLPDNELVFEQHLSCSPFVWIECQGPVEEGTEAATHE
jgi:hypothetical protein